MHWGYSVEQNLYFHAGDEKNSNLQPFLYMNHTTWWWVRHWLVRVMCGVRRDFTGIRNKKHGIGKTLKGIRIQEWRLKETSLKCLRGISPVWLQQQEANTDRQTPSREASEGASQQGMPEGSCAERNEAAQRGCTWKSEFGSPLFKRDLQKATWKAKSL